MTVTVKEKCRDSVKFRTADAGSWNFLGKDFTGRNFCSLRISVHYEKYSGRGREIGSPVRDRFRWTRSLIVEECCQLSQVLCYDSGIGGLSYLQELRALMPDYSWLYFADNANFPFGEKSESELQEIIFRNVSEMIARWEPHGVILLCNTASVSALARLRQAFPGLPFVGTVPAIKPAGEVSKARKIALLASGTTNRCSYVTRLMEEFAPDCGLTLIDGKVLIDFIEEQWHPEDGIAFRELARPYIRQVLESGADALVLGCTHFLHVEREFRAMLPDRIQICSSLQSVAKRSFQVFRPASGLEGRARNSEPKRDILWLNRVPEKERERTRWKYWAERFALEYQF